MSTAPYSTLIHLECSRTGAKVALDRLQNLSPAGAPLLARYDLERAARALTLEAVKARAPDLWRYHEVLPARTREDLVSLGEGMTPCLPLARLGRRFGLRDLWLKDDGLNPTGSFKARGLAVAVTMARALGARGLAIPSAGNAGGAAAAYAARAGLPVHVFVPEDTPAVHVRECEAAGAHVTRVAGTIADCGRVVAERAPAEGWFELATFKEPYRVEGKKTMAYELVEQLGAEPPDVIVYPTGGGTGLVGMWKAFAELEALGWIGRRRPRMVCVQAAGCAPLVRAHEAGWDHAEPWADPETRAFGLRVPRVLADALCLQAIRESGGTAVAVADDAMAAMQNESGRLEGIWPCLEGAACLAALPRLRERGALGHDERVVVFNTAAGYKGEPA